MAFPGTGRSFPGDDSPLEIKKGLETTHDNASTTQLRLQDRMLSAIPNAATVGVHMSLLVLSLFVADFALPECVPDNITLNQFCFYAVAITVYSGPPRIADSGHCKYTITVHHRTELPCVETEFKNDQYYRDQCVETSRRSTFQMSSRF